MNRVFLLLGTFFQRHSFKVLLVALFLLPVFGRGARRALESNDNDVHDWLPAAYQETADFNWFQQHFDNETFILASWEGCTLSDERLELLARKLVAPADNGSAAGGLFKKVETGTRLMERLTSSPLNLSETEAQRRLSGLFLGPDGEQTCALVTLTDQGKADLRTTLKSLYTLAHDELGLPRERLRLGGPPVDNVAISVEGEKTLLLLFIPAGIVGISLAWWCLRSVRLTVMVFSVAVYAGIICLAVVWYSGHAMNAILMSMPAVVYVAGISGAIHFANYYRDAVAKDGASGAAVRALRNAWLPCVLSATTTSAGLLSLCTSNLVPIRQFGLFSAIGVVATLLLLFLLLPAWMQAWPSKRNTLLDGGQPSLEDIDLPARWRRILGGVLHYHHWVFVGLLTLMAICGVGLLRIQTSVKLTKLFSPDAEIIHNYRWLEDRLGPLVPMEVVLRIDERHCPLTWLERMRLVERVQRELEQIDDVGNAMSAVTFAPTLKAERMGLLPKARVESVLSKRLEGHREEFQDNGFLAQEGSEQLWRISARVAALNDIDYGEFLQVIRQKIEGALAAERPRLVAAATAHAAAAARRSGQPEPAPIDAARVAQSISATYTGLVPVVYKAQREMLNGLAWNFAGDLATISIVMTVLFMDLSAGLILLIPSIFPLVIVFGMMGWLGITVDVGSVMAPVVALGVSVDDVVHFLIKYRGGLRKGLGRQQATMLAYESGARAMYQSWSVLGLGLAVFALSRFVPTQRFGALMFTLLTAALVGNLIQLPAVLNSPLGWLFGLRLRRRARSEKPPASGEVHVDPAAEPGPPLGSRRDPSHRSIRL
jgi:hypothetical protein